MQQAPNTIADAVKVATQCYNAFQTNVQPSHMATDTALQALMATMQELVAETKNKNNSNQGNTGNECPQYNNNQPRNNRYQPRQRQQMTNFQCYYCGKMGHRAAECRQLNFHRNQGREQEWHVNKQNQGMQGKGQPRQ